MIEPTVPVRVGISACLLGQEVRYDGGHKRDPFLVDTLGRFVEWVSVCPEAGSGLGTPREAMRLVQVGRDVALVTVKSARDVTSPLEQYIDRLLPCLADDDLSGFVLKKGSPSCGLERVKVYGPNGMPARSGRGLFAEALVRRFPYLPVEEEGRLSDPRLRAHFIERVFAYARVRALFRSRWTAASLVRFHTAHKLTLMAHAPGRYRSLGRFVAQASNVARVEVERGYLDQFLTAMAVRPSRRRHVNVLQHMAGYFKTLLDRDAKAELHGTIEEFRRGLVPLIVPVTLLRHHIRRHTVTYLSDQIYLDPYPRELMPHHP